MAWIKVGDNAYTYPKLVACASVPGAPESAVREMFGWFLSCSCYSAAHFEDYRVDHYIARKEGGTNADWLIKAATKTGLMKQKRHQGTVYLELIQDEAFVGIILKAEKDWQKQQQADTRNPALAVPVRLRDGDQCRYCRMVVSWMGKISPRRACFDHRDATQAAKSPDDLVMACFSCNSSRRDNGDEWDRTHPLLLPPSSPIYGVATAKFLTEHGHAMEPNVSDPKRGQRGGSAGLAAPTGARPAAEPAATSSIGGATPAPSWSLPGSLPGVSDSEGCGSRSAGSGRVQSQGGTGSRTGLDGAGQDDTGGVERPPTVIPPGRPGASGGRKRGSRGGGRKQPQNQRQGSDG